MKNILVLVLTLLCGSAFSQSNNYQVVAIAFYNLENFFDTVDDPNKADEEFTPGGSYRYTEKVYKEKLHNMATVIQKLGTDMNPDGVAFVGVSEVENINVLKDLANQPEIADRHYQPICFYGPDERGINNGFLYDPNYFRLIGAKARHVDLSSTGSHGATRDILFVTGVLPGNDTVYILVNHWPSRYGGEAASAPKRAKAASENRQIIDSVLAVYPQSKIVVMGDMNDDPTDESIMKVLGVTNEKNKVSGKYLYDPWINYYKKGIGTLGYNDAWNLFDQIIISKGLVDATNGGWKYFKSDIFNQKFMIEKYGQYKGYPKRAFSNGSWNNGYSDHLPVVMYFARPAR